VKIIKELFLFIELTKLMKKPIKILIVEDEIILAYGMKEVLENMGYAVVGIAIKESKAVALFKEKRPDVVLMDVLLKKGSKNGIETAKNILKIQKVPIIFITGSAEDEELMEQAQLVEPDAILNKPFSKVNVKNAISLALTKFETQVLEQEKPQKKEELYIWLEEGKGRNVKIYYKDILWIQSQRNDLTIYVKNSKKCYKNQSLKKFKEENLYEDFVQCQKSYIINVKHVDEFSNSDLSINEARIPIGQTYRKEVHEYLKQI